MKVGWYVHHHGRGHLHRRLAVADRLADATLTTLSSLPRPQEIEPDRWVELPLDTPVDPEPAATVTAGGWLHWAPAGHDGYRERMARIATWIAAARPDVMVVDVSVEVALTARLLGIPVVWIAQRGVRDDRPHRLAYAAAAAVAAPWTAALDAHEPGAPPPDKLHHLGALSRFDGHPPPAAAPRDPPRVLVLTGFGGHTLGRDDVIRAAAATPEHHWDLTGFAPGGRLPANVAHHSEDVDVWRLLRCASVVVASASGNAVAEVAAARRPLLCLPQSRPFDEQAQQARALARAGLAVHLERWPDAGDWPALLEQARHAPDRWSRLHDGHAAERLAEVLRRVAAAPR